MKELTCKFKTDKITYSKLYSRATYDNQAITLLKK